MSPKLWLGIVLLLVGLLSTPANGRVLEPQRRDGDEGDNLLGFPQLLRTDFGGEELEEGDEDDDDDDKRDMSAASHPVREIKALTDYYVEAVEHKDLEGIRELYRYGALLMPEGHPTFRLTNEKLNLDWIHSVSGIEIVDQMVAPIDEEEQFVADAKHYRLIGADGSVVVDGKSFIIWTKGDDGYKIGFEMYNRNN